MSRQGPRLVNIQIPTPTVGSDFVYELPASLGECQVMSLTFRLITSAAVATRSVVVSIRDPQGNPKSQVEAGASQGLIVTRRYTLGTTGTDYAGSSGDNHHMPWQSAYVRGQDFIQSAVVNLQAADVLDRIFLWLEQFAPHPPNMNKV